MPGVPMVFAGDEVGLTGVDGDGARQPMPWDEARWDRDVLDAYRALGALRRASRALRHGGLRWVHAGDDVLVFLREARDERVLVQVARRDHEPVVVAGLDGDVGARAVRRGRRRPARRRHGRAAGRRRGRAGVGADMTDEGRFEAMADVVLDGMTKIYENGFEAVSDLDLDIADGEFLVLVGPSGCGKTTALRMIAGLESITKGELRIGGRRVNEVPSRDRDIAMVFQSYALYPHMSVARQHQLRAQAAQDAQAGDRHAGSIGRARRWACRS